LNFLEKKTVSSTEERENERRRREEEASASGDDVKVSMEEEIETRSKRETKGRTCSGA
jgi:hypothetical protein